MFKFLVQVDLYELFVQVSGVCVSSILQLGVKNVKNAPKYTITVQIYFMYLWTKQRSMLVPQLENSS